MVVSKRWFEFSGSTKFRCPFFTSTLTLFNLFFFYLSETSIYPLLRHESRTTVYRLLGTIPPRTEEPFSLEIFLLDLKFSLAIENFNPRPCLQTGLDGKPLDKIVISSWRPNFFILRLEIGIFDLWALLGPHQKISHSAEREGLKKMAFVGLEGPRYRNFLGFSSAVLEHVLKARA